MDRGGNAIVVGARGRECRPLITAWSASGVHIHLCDSDVNALAAYDDMPLVETYTVAPDTADAWFEAFAEQAHPSLLVTCPPPPQTKPSFALGAADWRAAFTQIVDPAFAWSTAFGRKLLNNGWRGNIVHITGIAGLGGWAGWAAVGAAYAAVHHLTQTLAVEWAARGIRVNALAIGMREADVALIGTTRPMLDLGALQARVPAGRLLTDSDWLGALDYLSAPTSPYVSGQVLAVDGGWDTWGRLHASARKEVS